MINQIELKKLFNYTPLTGIFTRLNSNTYSTTGHVRGDGYIVIKINSKSYKAHRLAWLYIHGKFPDNVIDHINGDTSDNRIYNLREATHQENSRNRKKQENNTSGYVGVIWHKKNEKWIATCKINGKRKYIGSFDSAEIASLARNDFVKVLFGEFYKEVSRNDI